MGSWTARHREPGPRLLVGSVQVTAHALGLVLVAEGVEDQATLDALGYDPVQGCHLSRPIPPDALLRRLEERAAGPAHGRLPGGASRPAGHLPALVPGARAARS